ncbi:MAG: hypothetical protein DI536_03505 [Archangium gephyra]|uniref:DUF1552 domain-containing protein n=1 Tax=Archangium gephyra TaxID=48 RepID=A0A2W5W2M6_9BACT|nr:MAG: hypothetical protein DI536_03505 [Archangium gephyra]
MKFDPLSRRMFLRAAGGGLLTIPTLASLLPRSAAAQVSGAPPLRFVMFTNEHGSNEGVFFGAMKGRRANLNLENANGNALVPSVGHRALADLPGDVSYLLAPFTPLKNKISVLRSLDIAGAEGGAHPMSFPSCGSGMGPSGGGWFNNAGTLSVDSLIARKIYGAANVPSTRRQLVLSPEYNLEFKRGQWVERGYSSATFGLNSNWDGTTPYKRATRIAAVANTQTLMSKFVFDGGQGGATQGFDRRKILDRVYENYRRVSTDSRLSAEDRRKLEAYLSLVGELQNDSAPPSSHCESPQLENEPVYIPNEGTAAEREAIEDLRIRNHIRIVAAAMLCDLTRVAAISVYAGSHTYHHTSNMFTHTPTTNADAAKFWGKHLRIAKMVASLMTTMNSFQESHGTLLDNSIVYWAQQYATLYTSGGAHSSHNMPVVIGGGAQGKLRMGQFMDFRTSEGPTASSYRPRGVPLNNLLVTMMNCYGLSSTDYEVTSGQGMGAYDGALGTALAESSKTTAARRSALPFLYQGPALG